MGQKETSILESESTSQQLVYEAIIKQPLAPMVLRVGLVNLSSTINQKQVQFGVEPLLREISQIVSELASRPVAKQVYNTEQPLLRLVSKLEIRLPESELVGSEYLRVDKSASSNSQVVANDHHQVGFDSSIHETSSDDQFVAKQVMAHSDVALLVVDETNDSESMLAEIINDQSNSKAVPLVIELKLSTHGSKGLEITFLRSTSGQLSDCLSEILLFDSLLSALPASDEVSNSVLKSHSLQRIADFVAEDSLELNNQQADFDFQGPIKVKSSILSWRNVFTRFINFLSPINNQSITLKKHQSDSPDSIPDSSESSEQTLLAMSRSKSCHYLYALFMRADQLAIQYANAHRSSFILIYCLGAFALINAAIAIGFSDIGWLALSSALAEFFALVAIFLIYRNDHKKRYHIKWLEYRSLAEILRVSPHLNSLGMVFTTTGLERHRVKEDGANLSAHSVGRTWLIIYSESIKRWLDFSNITLTQNSLQQGRAFLTEKLIVGQTNYHFKNAHRMHYAGHSLGKFSYILFVLAFLFVSGKLLTKFLNGLDLGLDPMELHHIGHYLGFLAAVCPMLGSAAFAIRNHAEFDISSQRSQTMLKKLNWQLEQFRELGDSISYRKLHDICQETALIMQSETADWLEIYEVKETEPA